MRYLNTNKGLLLEVDTKDILDKVFLVPNLILQNVSYNVFKQLGNNYLLDYTDENEVLLDGIVTTDKITKINW